MKQAPRRDMVIIVLVGLLAVTVILTVSLWSRSGSGRLTYHQAPLHQSRCAESMTQG